MAALKKDGKPKKPKSKHDKATDAEVERRITIVLDMLLNSLTYRQICLYASENWKLTSRQTERYIARAHDAIRQQQDKSRGMAYERAVSSIEDMIRRERQRGKIDPSYYDPRAELDIRRELHKLLGVYPAEKQEVKVDVQGLAAKSTDELKRIIAARRTKLALPDPAGGPADGGGKPC